MKPEPPRVVYTEHGPVIEVGMDMTAFSRLTPAERMSAVSAPPPAPTPRATPTLRPVFVTAPTAAELIARGRPPADDSEGAGQPWTPQRLPDVREHLLRRLGFITDPEPATTEQEPTE